MRNSIRFTGSESELTPQDCCAEPKFLRRVGQNLYRCANRDCKNLAIVSFIPFCSSGCRTVVLKRYCTLSDDAKTILAQNTFRELGFNSDRTFRNFIVSGGLESLGEKGFIQPVKTVHDYYGIWVFEIFPALVKVIAKMRRGKQNKQEFLAVLDQIIESARRNQPQVAAPLIS